MPDVEKPEHNLIIDGVKLSDPKNTMLTNEGELQGLISAIKPTGAAGLDKIDHYLLRRNTAKAIKRLTLILNACVTISYFPQKWKLSWITMIPKPGKDLSKSCNYRPILLCSTLGKIL